MEFFIKLLKACGWPHVINSVFTESESRARSRQRAIAMTAVASVLAKSVAIAVALISIPLTFSYLGIERFGMWMVLSSFTLLLSFLDLGIGNSTINAVAAASASQGSDQLQRKISSAYALGLVVAGLVIALISSIYKAIPWSLIYNVKEPMAVAEAGPASAVFFIILAFMTPLNLIFRIQLGLQQGFRSNIWQSVGGIASLVAIFFATKTEASLPMLVLALFGVPMLATFVNTIHFFGYVRPDLRPRLAQVERKTIQQLLSGGLLFLVLQVCAALMFQTNAIFIAQILGPEAVSTFVIAERLFSPTTFIIGLILIPIWPAYREALENNDNDWIKRIFKKSLIFSLGFSAVLSVFFVITGASLISFWVGDKIIVPISVLVGLGIWKVMEAAGNAVAMLLNGLNVIGLQAALAVLNAIANLGLKIWLIELLGLPGVMLATIIAYGVFALPWLAIMTKRALMHQESFEKRQ